MCRDRQTYIIKPDYELLGRSELYLSGTVALSQAASADRRPEDAKLPTAGGAQGKGPSEYVVLSIDDGGLVGDSGNKAITLLEKRSFVCRARQGRPAPGGPPLMHEVKKQAGRGVE